MSVYQYLLHLMQKLDWFTDYVFEHNVPSYFTDI